MSGFALEIQDAEQAASAAKSAEFFETPREAIEPLILAGPRLPGGVWCDPCAGRGRIPNVVNELRQDIRWVLGELREECFAELRRVKRQLQKPNRGDFLSGWLRSASPSVVIFNSPFSLTTRFVLNAWGLWPDAWVVSLQRQSWIGPARVDWLAGHMPDRYVLGERPSFRLDGSTDACEYEWHVWPPWGRNRHAGATMMLPTLASIGQLRMWE